MDMRTDRASQKAERVCDRNSPLPCICIYLSAYLSLLGINLSPDKQNKVTDKAVGTVQVRTAFQFCERFGVALNIVLSPLCYVCTKMLKNIRHRDVPFGQCIILSDMI